MRFTVRSGLDLTVRDFADYESETPGWFQMQRMARPWFEDRVAAGDLMARDLTIWFWVASATSLRDGLARVSCNTIARDLGYGHWGHVSLALKRLQQAGAIHRVRQGVYMASPWLVRAGGIGRHREWFCRWAEFQAEIKARPGRPTWAKGSRRAQAADGQAQPA